MCVFLLSGSLLSRSAAKIPLTQQKRQLGDHERHWYKMQDKRGRNHVGDRQAKSVKVDLNMRREAIRRDQIIRQGYETLPRRSDFLEW